MEGSHNFCNSPLSIMDGAAGTHPAFNEDLPAPYFTNFLDLPPELRDNVYEKYFATEYHYLSLDFYVNKRAHFVDWPTLHVSKPTRVITPATAKFLPNLALTSHQVRKELVRALLRTAKNIVLADSRAAMCFRVFVDGFNAYNLVRSLTFHQYDEGVIRGDYAVLEFIKRCPNLRKLELIVSATSLGHSLYYSWRTAPRSLGRIVAELKLVDVLKSKSLRQIQLTGTQAEVQAASGGLYGRSSWRASGSFGSDIRNFNCLPVLHEVRAWMQETSRENGHQVTLSVSVRSSRALGS